MPDRTSSPEVRRGAQSRQSPVASSPRAFDWGIAALVVGTLVYFVQFYYADPRKFWALRWILIPDLAVKIWAGGDTPEFAILDRIPILFAASLILLVSWATGRLALSVLAFDRRVTRLEHALFSLGVGLNLWSLYVLATGLAGLLQNRWILFGPALPVAILTGLWMYRTLRPGHRFAGPTPASDQATDIEESGDTDPYSDRWSRMVVGFCCLFGLFLLLGSVLSPWHFDVREYHLQVPKEWFRQGAVEFMPHNVYGNMPLGAEMHAVLGMALMPGPDNWWWGALVGKTIIGVFAILTALSIYACGKRFVSAAAGIVGAFAFLSTPWIAHVSTAGLIESAVAFYFMVTVHGAMIWWRGTQLANVSEKADRVPSNSSSSSPNPDGTNPDGADPANENTSRTCPDSATPSKIQGQQGLVLLTGFLAGAAVACKYPSVLFLVIPVLLFVVFCGMGRWDFRAARMPHWRAGVLFLLGVGTASGLWFGKNLVLTGNPTYPLLYEVFDGKSRTEAKHQQWKRAHRTPTDSDGKSFTFSQLADSISKLALQSQFTSPLLLPLVVAAWGSRRHRKLVLWWTAFLAFGFFGWWVLTHRIDRFLLPLLPIVCLLVGVGATWTSNRVWRWWVTALLIWCLTLNLLLVTSEEIGNNRFFWSLAAARVVSHPGHAYLNQHVKPGNRAMLVGDAQAFNVAVPVLYNTCFDDCVFEQRFRGKTTKQRRQTLRDQRISHILVDWHELNRYRSPGNYGYSDFVTPELLQAEFVETGLLRPVSVGLDPETAQMQMYEVQGVVSSE